MAFTCRLCGENGEERLNFIYLFDNTKLASENLRFIQTQLCIYVFSDDLLTKYVCQSCGMKNDHFLNYLKKCRETQTVLYERFSQAKSNDVSTSSLCAENVELNEEPPSKKKIKREHHNTNDIIETAVLSNESTQIDVNTGRVPTADNVPVPAQIAAKKKTTTESSSTDVNIQQARASVASRDTRNIIDGEPQLKMETEMEYHNINNDSGNENLAESLNSDVSAVYDIESDHEERESEAEYVSTIVKLDHEESESEDEYAPLSQQPSLRCLFCKMTMLNQKALNDHFCQNHKDISSCSFCDFVTPIKQTLNDHIKECHDKNSKCNICDVEFSSESQLRIHIADIHSDCDEPMNCSLCDKVFKQKYELQRHQRLVHSVDNRLMCRICKQQFTGRNLLKLHLTKIHSASAGRFKHPVHNKEVHVKRTDVQNAVN